VDPIELIAALFGLTSVWLCVRRNIWNWPVGLVQVVLYAWVFFGARLYADFGLQLIYIVLQLYGWYHWLRGGQRDATHELPVTRWPVQIAVVWLVIAAFATAVEGFLLRRYTNAAFPYWDGAIAVLSLLATYLLARKVLENWLIWITVDVLGIGVYFAKDLYVTAGLYAVFLCMATAGWFAWRKNWREQQRTISAADLELAAGSSSVNSSRPTADTSSSSTSPAFTVPS
jgi:nicotinamide mononucleotide transporter